MSTAVDLALAIHAKVGESAFLHREVAEIIKSVQLGKMEDTKYVERAGREWDTKNHRFLARWKFTKTGLALVERHKGRQVGEGPPRTMETAKGVEVSGGE